MKLNIKDVEKKFGIKLKKHEMSLGLDTASKTGYCIAWTEKKYIYFDIGFINVDVKGIKDKAIRNAIRYKEIYDNFKQLIINTMTVVIEDVYYAGNAQTLILLSRIGAIAWTLATEKECENIIWKSAVQARKMLGLPCNKKKIVVMKEVNKRLKINLTNEDEIDAIVLALVGLMEK